MKLTSLLLTILLISVTSMAYGNEIDIEIDFIKGSDYAEDFRVEANNEVKFIDGFAKSNFANDELETDFISGSEYAAMDAEHQKKSWLAFLSFK